MKYTYIATVLLSLSLSLSGTPENQTFDDTRHNDLIILMNSHGKEAAVYEI
jgi:hypothetical protein